MTETIIVGVLSLIGTLGGSLFGILAANKLTTFRIEELEKKVEKHNNVIERVVLLEQSVNTAWKRIDEIHDTIDEIKKEVYSHEI
jgi:tetrahydromethanopterin S-methyltransferase subunit G